MSDISVEIEGMTAHVEGLTDAGIEFVDAYVNPQMTAVDAGRIDIPYADLADLLVRIKQARLTYA